MIYSLAPDVIIERLGDEIILANNATAHVVRFKAEGVVVSDGMSRTIEIRDPDEVLIRELHRAEVIVSVNSDFLRPVSRRSILAGGASGALAGFGVLSLPSVAVASSAPFPVRAGIWEQDGSRTAEFIVNESDFPEIDVLEPALNWEENTDWTLTVAGLVSDGAYDYWNGTFSWMMDFVTSTNLTNAQNAATTYTGTLTSPSAGVTFTVIFTYSP